jgi:hypothetical protein
MILVERGMDQVTTGDKKKTKVACLDFFKALYAKVQEDMRVSTLQIPASIEKLERELNQINALISQIDGWPRSGYEARRKQCEEVLAEAKEDFKTLMDMRDPMEIVHEDVKAAGIRVNRKVRDQTKAVVDEMIALDVPEGLARVIADKNHERGARRDLFQDGMAYGVLSQTSTFDRPTLFTYDGDAQDQERTYWHPHLNEIWLAQDVVVKPLVPKAEKGLARRSITHLYKPITDTMTKVSPNPPGPASSGGTQKVIVQPFDVAGDLTPVLYVQQCGSYPCRRAAPPNQYVNNK